MSATATKRAAKSKMANTDSQPSPMDLEQSEAARRKKPRLAQRGSVASTAGRHEFRAEGRSQRCREADRWLSRVSCGVCRCQCQQNHVSLAEFEVVVTSAKGLPLRQAVPSVKLECGWSRGFLKCMGFPVGNATSRPQAGD
jgi:hypothetical protein